MYVQCVIIIGIVLIFSTVIWFLRRFYEHCHDRTEDATSTDYDADVEDEGDEYYQNDDDDVVDTKVEVHKGGNPDAFDPADKPMLWASSWFPEEKYKGGAPNPP